MVTINTEQNGMPIDITGITNKQQQICLARIQVHCFSTFEQTMYLFTATKIIYKNITSYKCC
jgi:hypothetical protein